jgi:hypothetical protein
MLYTHQNFAPSSGHFPSRFPTRHLYAFLLIPIRAIRSVSRVLLDLIVLIILDEEHELRDSLLAVSLTLVSSSLLRANVILRALLSKILSLCSYLNIRDKMSHTHTEPQINFQSHIYYNFYILRQQTRRRKVVD